MALHMHLYRSSTPVAGAHHGAPKAKDFFGNSAQ